MSSSSSDSVNLLFHSLNDSEESLQLKRLIRTNGFSLLDDIITRGNTSLTLLETFCKESLCEEVLHCYFAIQDYQNPQKTPEDKLQEVVCDIYNAYIMKNAWQEVNLNQELRDEVSRRMEEFCNKKKVQGEEDDEDVRQIFEPLLHELSQLPKVCLFENCQRIGID